MRPFLRPVLRLGIPAGVILAALALGGRPVVAQEQGAALIVSVRAGGTGEPLRGASVFLDGTGMGGLTDAAGMLRLDGLPPGPSDLSVRYLGYASARKIVRLMRGQTSRITVALEPEPIPLAEVSVRVRASPGVRRLVAVGFYRRMEHGPGSFITRSEIEERNPARSSELLRTVPGIRLIPTAFSDYRAAMVRSSIPGRQCPIQYVIDGMPAFAFRIDDVPPGDIEALEIYRGSSEIPPSFNRGTALCGVIVIWTRID